MTNNLKATILLLGIINLPLISCSLAGMQKRYNIRCTMLLYKYPVVMLNGDLRIIADSLLIYDYDQKVIYALPYTHTEENNTSVFLRETRYNYFAYKQGEIYGRYYNSVNSVNYNKVQVDSILKERGFSMLNFHNTPNDSLIEQAGGNGWINLTEKYVAKFKPDQSYPDTINFYYTHTLKGLEFSLSPEQERLRNLKVCKVQLIYNSQFYQGYSFKFPYREFVFELKEIKTPAQKDIISIFDALQ